MCKVLRKQGYRFCGAFFLNSKLLIISCCESFSGERARGTLTIALIPGHSSHRAPAPSSKRQENVNSPRLPISPKYCHYPFGLENSSHCTVYSKQTD